MSVNDAREPVAEYDGTHTCPIGGCARRVPDHQLMCGRHWRLVGPNLRSRLYQAWDRGAGQFSDEHQEAMRLCVEEVEFKLGNGGERTATGAPAVRRGRDTPTTQQEEQ